MSTHTPGPWEVVPTYWARSPYEAEDAPREVSNYWVREPGAMRIYSEADARLIAAAPDLLAALRPFLQMDASDDEITAAEWNAAIVMARAAIAKAEPTS